MSKAKKINYIAIIEEDQQNKIREKKENNYKELPEEQKAQCDINPTIHIGDKIIVYNARKTEDKKTRLAKLCAGVVTYSTTKTLFVFSEKSKGGDWHEIRIEREHPNIFTKIVTKRVKRHKRKKLSIGIHIARK